MLNRILCSCFRPARSRQLSIFVVSLCFVSATSAHALVVDFDAIPEGTIISGSVLPAGFSISVENNNAAHPDQAIVFDSACNPSCSGDDVDLQTPGLGVGNTTAQEHVMVVAENIRDNSPPDGIVDDPDDEKAGGAITLTFGQARKVESVRVVDVDTNETHGFIELELTDGGTFMVAIPGTGNNSAHSVSLAGTGFANSMKIVLQGSGAIDDIVLSDDQPPSFCPENVIDFQDDPAGTIVSSTQTAEGQTVGVKGTNPKFGAGVNAAVLYDSSCIGGTCTGGDADLGTPNEDFGGPGVGSGGSSGSPTQNDRALGNVLIVDTFLTDANDDDLVDSPNDQKSATVTMELDFSAFAPTSVLGFDVVDAGDTEGAPKVELFGSSNNLITSVNIPDVENNGLVEVVLPPNQGVFRMVVTLHGSGAIDNVRVACPPGSTTTTLGDGGTTTTLGDGGTTTTLSSGSTTTLGNTTTTLGDGGTTTTLGDGGTTTTVVVPPPPTTTTLGDGGTTTTLSSGSTTTLGDGSTTTTLPGNICGDGIVQPPEQCDDGVLNSDTTPNACRTNCTLPFCGDGVVDTGEICEPVITAGCNPGTCTLELCPLQVEICNNGLDDDNDGNIDCFDTDCPRQIAPPCGCEGLLRDPAMIRFDSKYGGDYFSIHGNFRVHTQVDFEAERWGVMLANANGMIWRGTLIPGELKKKKGGKGRYVFRDPSARGGGPGDSDNFYRVGLRLRPHGNQSHLHFRIRAYGDFSAATEPEMSLQLAIGDDTAATTQIWERTRRGWILHLRDFDSDQ